MDSNSSRTKSKKKCNLTVEIKKEEWRAVIFSFFYFFCILTAYYLIRPLREQLASKAGSAQLPLFFSVTFIATLMLTPLFAWLISHWSRKIVVPLAYFFFISGQLVFIPVFSQSGIQPSPLLEMMFFVWVSVFNLFVVSVFWSFMADIWNDEQARRLFPLIGLGGTLGAVLGPIITRNLVDVVGIAPLLAFSSLFLFCAIVCVYFLGKWAHQFGMRRHEPGDEAALGGGMLDGIKQVFNNPFMSCMALLMLLGDAISTIAYALIIDYSGTTFPDDAIARTRFAADIDFFTNSLQTVVQLSLTPFLLVRYGAGVVIGLWAIIEVAACLVMTFSTNPYAPIIGSLPTVALVLIMIRSLSFGMLQPARESLFTLVPRELRYKGKNAVDTVVWRAGDIASAFAIQGMRSLGISTVGLGGVSACLIACSGLLGFFLAKWTEQPKH